MQGQAKSSDDLGVKLERIAQHLARTQGMPEEFRGTHVNQILASLADPAIVATHAALAVDQSLYAIKLLPFQQQADAIMALRDSDAMHRTQQIAVSRPYGVVQRHARIGLEAIKALPRDMQQEALEDWLYSPYVTEAPDSVGYKLDIIAELPLHRQTTLLGEMLSDGQLDKLAAHHPQGYAQQAARLATMMTADDARARGIVLSPIPKTLTGEYGLNTTFAQTALEAGHEDIVKPQQLHILTMPASLPPVLITDAPREALAIETVISDYGQETEARKGIARHMRALSQDNTFSPAQRKILLEMSEVIRGAMPEASGPQATMPVSRPAFA